MKWSEAIMITLCKCLTSDAERCFRLRGVTTGNCFCLCHDHLTWQPTMLKEAIDVQNMTDEEVNAVLVEHGIDPDAMLLDLVHHLNAKLIEETDETEAERLRVIIRELSNEL